MELPSQQIQAHLERFALVDDLDDISTHFLASAYELALRLGVSPRTVCDSGFQAVSSDVRWPTLRTALLTTLGRD